MKSINDEGNLWEHAECLPDDM